MHSDLQSVTNGVGFAADALPFKDLEPAGTAQFVLKDGVVLLNGSVSKSSGSLAFPSREVCIETGARDMEPMQFGPEGTLYSFTTIRVSAKREVPYTIGYVDFDNGVRVLAHVRANDLASLSCDQRVITRAEGNEWFVVPTTEQEVQA